MTITEPLTGDLVVLRPATIADAADLAAVVNSPGVVGWWSATSVAEMETHLGEIGDELVVYRIELDGELVGLVQYGQELDPQYRHGNIDISVLAAHHRKGIATDTIRTLARHLFDDLGHHRIVIDPAAHNEIAIACYSSLGFRPVGVMRSYERGPDGTFHDGLLMDLLVGELR